MTNNDERDYAEEAYNQWLMNGGDDEGHQHVPAESDPLGPCAICGSDPLAAL